MWALPVSIAVGPVKRLQILPVVIHRERVAAMPAVVE
jgi:hypothetical protein